MDVKKALCLIIKCLDTGGDKMVGYDSQDREPNITVRDGARYEVRTSYDLDLKSVKVLSYYEYRSPKDWDGDFVSYAIFSFDKGFGVAYNTGWWGPTFGEDKFDMDIQESLDWEKFCNMVLTDEIRGRLRENDKEDLDMDLAEITLLHKECDQ